MTIRCKRVFLSPLAGVLVLSSGASQLTDYLETAKETYSLSSYATSAIRRIDFKHPDWNLIEELNARGVRAYDVPGLTNVRDIGGWTGLPTGKVFRGGCLELTHKPETDEANIRACRDFLVNRHGIRVDLNLQSPQEIASTNRVVLSKFGLRAVRCPVVQYMKLFEPRWRESFGKALRAFADPANYPLYIHCAGGADRTGTIILLVEALCGVPEPYLSIDYELTSFAIVHGFRHRDNAGVQPFRTMMERIRAYPGETLAEKTENCVLENTDLTSAEIAAIRENLRWSGTPAADRAKPTLRQLEWADCEIGVIIHQDVQVYEPSYSDHADTNVPPARVFNPTALDTDQWIATAKKAGAQYAVLVAKHCSGFSLWPTKAHGYSVASSPWKNGKGDIVADFVASCRKFGIRPGLYASMGRNNYFGISDLTSAYKTIPEAKWNRYLDLVRTQMTELWSNYGDLFEIWFDGGNLPANRGGREMDALLAKLQPTAIVFQGNPATSACCRWCGNENATSLVDCWSRWTPPDEPGDPAYLKTAAGAPDGRYWCPTEADIPNRKARDCFQGGWFWRAGEEKGLYAPEELVDRYLKSVGRNSNMLIGMVIDNRGLVPEADVAQFTRFGELVRGLYAHPVARIAGRGVRFEVEVSAKSGANLCSIREDISYGERVNGYTLSGYRNGKWHDLATGLVVGQRRLISFKSSDYTRFRLDFGMVETGLLPQIRDIEFLRTSLEKD